jgi:hypothetical protein
MDKSCSYGEKLEELIKLPMGLLVLIGADGEDDESEKDEGDESEDEGDEDDESEESGDADPAGKGKKDEKSDDDPKDRQITNLEEALARNVSKRKDAQKRTADLEAEIARLKKDGTSDPALKKHYEDLENNNKALVTTNQELALKVAFLSDNTHEWQDPKAALRLAELDDVEIDDTGKVDGLSVALDKLAKDMPWLLKAKVKPKSKKQDDVAPRSGDQPGGAPGSEASQKAQAAKLRSKYPGLRR